MKTTMKIHWEKDDFSIEECWNLIHDETKQRLAFVVRQSPNCDRGHWMGHVEVGDLNNQDGWPNYYMDVVRAMQEIVAFIHWRLDKIPALETELVNGHEATLLSMDPTVGAVNAANSEADANSKGVQDAVMRLLNCPPEDIGDSIVALAKECIKDGKEDENASR